MPNDFLSSDLFLLTLTVGLYCAGSVLYRRARTPLLHPVLLTFAAVIVFLSATGIGYERYREATGILNFALGMSVVALGYLLYEQIERLRGSLLPVGGRHPCRMFRRSAERGLYCHGLRHGAPHPHLDRPQVGHRSDRRVGRGTARRRRLRHLGGGLLRGNIRQRLRRVDTQTLRRPRSRGARIRPGSRGTRHRHGTGHRDRRRGGSPERSGDGPDGAGHGALPAP